MEAASRRLGLDFQSSSGGGSGSSGDLHVAGSRDSCGYSVANSNTDFSVHVPSVKKKDRIIESEKPEPVLSADPPLASSLSLDSNGLSKGSTTSFSLSGSNCSSDKNSHSLSSCSSCCSKMSIENEKKSPVIHVKLYSSTMGADGNSGGTGRQATHMLCHKVPLTSLSCCSECRSAEHVNPCSCLCSSLSSGLSLDGEGDKKSTCGSLISSGACGCAEEVSCACAKGSQITCEVDLVFEGENVQNVPMKNETLEAENIGYNCDV